MPKSEANDPQGIHPGQAVVVFDGVCGLCNKSVDFILKRDTHERFLFAPNQSEAARAILTDKGIDPDNVDTIYLYDQGTIHKRSGAVIQIASKLPLPWRLAAAGRYIPTPVRDGAYAFVAKNRYRWFGQNETCRIPTSEERARFLK